MRVDFSSRRCSSGYMVKNITNVDMPFVILYSLVSRYSIVTVDKRFTPEWDKINLLKIDLPETYYDLNPYEWELTSENPFNLSLNSDRS